MAPTFRVTLDTARLDAIAADLQLNRDVMLEVIGFEIELEAKLAAPVDTGALRASIYTDTGKESGYGEAAATAANRNPDVELVEIPRPETGHVHVGPAVEYGIYQELGTSKMAAQPYMVPGAEKVFAKYEVGAEWRRLVDA